jgi:hypothetical protein
MSDGSQFGSFDGIESLPLLAAILARNTETYETGSRQDRRDAIASCLLSVASYLASNGIDLRHLQPLLHPVEALKERENNRLDPINKVDPTGTSCTTTGKEGSVTVACKFDDRAGFRKAGFSSSQIRAAERQHTRAVQKLLSNPNALKKIKVGDSKFKVTAGEIGRGLAKSYVTFDKGGARQGARAKPRRV